MERPDRVAELVQECEKRWTCTWHYNVASEHKCILRYPGIWTRPRDLESKLGSFGDYQPKTDEVVEVIFFLYANGAEGN